MTATHMTIWSPNGVTLNGAVIDNGTDVPVQNLADALNIAALVHNEPHGRGSVQIWEGDKLILKNPKWVIPTCPATNATK